MRIIFLCGSIEPGRDGVGDYTRRLVGELLREGHQAAIIALNDQYISEEFNGVQDADGIALPVLRLPSYWLPVQRFQRAGTWIDNFSPDWLSLQFVPFAFHKKGLAFGLGKKLKKLGKRRSWHLMFHELWVGMHKNASKKEVLWGFVQRRMILSLISRLQPRVIHTQSSLYKTQLEKLDVKANLLPLFSNIPVVTNKPFFPDKKEDQGFQKEKISLVLFGGIHGGAPVEDFAKEIKAYSIKTGIGVFLILLGRGGDGQKFWEQTWLDQGLEVVLKGEQSPEEISEILHNASYGITTTVFGKVEKSGSVAAMIEHGLNVICVAAAWQPKALPLTKKIPGVVEYKPGVFESFVHLKKESSFFCKVEDVAKYMISSFTSTTQTSFT